MKVKKRIYLMLLALTLLLGSCGVKDEREEISILIRADYEHWFTQMKEQYEALHPDRRITLVPLAGTEDNYYAKSTLMLQSDRSLDGLMQDTFTLRSDVEAGYLAPIDKLDEWYDWQYFYDGVRDAGAVNGVIYGIPFTSDARGIFYSKPILESLGVATPWQPKSWQEIIDLALLVKQQRPELAPIYFNGGKGEATTMQTFQMLLYGTNDEMYEEGKWVVSSKGLSDAMAFIEFMIQNDLTVDPAIISSSAMGNVAWEQMFANDQIAMLLDGNWNSGWNFSNHAKGRDYAMTNYGFAKMPTQYEDSFITMSGGWVFSVSNLSQKKELVLDFFQFITGKDQLMQYFEVRGEIAPRSDIPEIAGYQGDPIRVAATEFLEYSRYRPTNISYASVSAELYKAVEQVVLGNSAQSALAEYRRNVSSLVGADNVVDKA